MYLIHDPTPFLPVTLTATPLTTAGPAQGTPLTLPVDYTQGGH